MRWKRTERSLTCRELVELVTEYLEGALPAAQAARFEAHLESCPDCRIHVAQLAATVNALGALPGEPLHDDALGALLVAFRARH
jgi:anti-sigma factor RsiW